MHAQNLLAIVLTIYTVSAQAQQLTRARAERNLVYYSGTIIVSGRFAQELENEFTPGLCFYPQGETAKLIPRGGNDDRIPWFCFSNQADAVSLLKLPKKPKPGICEIEGIATIVISNYVVDNSPSEVSDLAEIRRVVNLSGLTHKPCKR